MRLYMKFTGLFFFIIILGIATVSAQSVIQRFEIGAGIGGMNYKGDVAQRVDVLNTRPAGNFHIRFNFMPSLSWRTGVTVGQITGSDERSNDPFLQERNFSFSSLLIEGNTILEYHFFDYRRDLRIDRFSPYIFGGISVTRVSANPGEGTPYSAVSFITPGIPFGVGIKKVINTRLSLNLEFSTTKTFKDDLDGIFDNPSLPKSQRVPHNDPDTYYYLGTSISYRFSNLICPPHFNNSLPH